MSNSEEKVCIFIDDSNLFIEGMKYFAKEHHFVVKQDRRFRIEFNNLIEVLARKRPILCKKLYGSLSNGSIYKTMKEEGIKVRVFDRGLKGQEKEVDVTLASDVVDKAACLRFQSTNKPGSVTFIIVSGDRDYLQAFRKVHKHGWKLEVVCWETAISQSVKYFISVNKSKGAKLITLDELMPEYSSFYFVETRWPSQSEGENPCFVFEYSTPQTEDNARLLSFRVVNLIKRPCQYLRPDNDPKIVKIILLVEYKNHDEMDLDEMNVIREFQTGTCRRVSFSSNKDLDSNELIEEDDDDDDDNVESVEERCIYKFSCNWGNTCHRRHTRFEREHFKVNSDHLGAKYKSRMCRHVQAKRCAFMNRPRKCPWAHGLSDARCYHCDAGGLVGDHWMDNCPKPKRINPSQTEEYEPKSYGLSDDSECEILALDDESKTE